MYGQNENIFEFDNKDEAKGCSKCLEFMSDTIVVTFSENHFIEELPFKK